MSKDLLALISVKVYDKIEKKYDVRIKADVTENSEGLMVKNSEGAQLPLGVVFGALERELREKITGVTPDSLPRFPIVDGILKYVTNHYTKESHPVSALWSYQDMDLRMDIGWEDEAVDKAWGLMEVNSVMGVLSDCLESVEEFNPQLRFIDHTWVLLTD